MRANTARQELQRFGLVCAEIVLLLVAAASQADTARSVPSPPVASVSMSINGREVTASSASLTADEIQELMLKVGNSVVPSAQPGKPRGRKANCTITGDASDPKVALLRVRCNDWVIDVARLCAPAPCRYEANQRLYLPPRKSS
jgi:hypothetical protein